MVHVVMETTKTSHFACQTNFFTGILFTCQVSACELQRFPCHDLANNIYSQTAKTVFSRLIFNFSVNAICYLKAECTSSAFQVHLNSNALQVYFRV